VKYIKGHIDKFWNDEFKNFNYVKQPITDVEKNIWISQGYTGVKSFTGSMYDSRNPMPLWISKFDNLFGLKNQTYTFYKMSTLEIMPLHNDHFSTYVKLFNSELENVHRVVVMLEDWKSGHYLEVDKVGIINWSAGDYVIWNHDCQHAASNIGIEDRYTLQITGELNDAGLE
jgi:hypothetical protein